MSASHPPIIGVKKHVPKEKKILYFTEVMLASEEENTLPLKPLRGKKEKKVRNLRGAA